MQKTKWIFKSSELPPERINAFSKECGVPYEFSTVLLNRGIENKEQLMQYMKKTLKNIHSPMLLPDIQPAVERIKKAVDEQEKIVIYGDYDVDGVTSTALLYSYLRSINAPVSYYIPDRIKEGYGVNIMAVNRLAKQGTKLLITVDCGITSVGEVELAKVLNMDVIITDHHTCKEKLPDAIAVINPKRPDSEYPFRELCGAGVAFKIVLALAKEIGQNTTEVFNRYVEFAAIGTIADVVSLTDENRIIADRGVKLLQNTQIPGLKTLLEVCGVKNSPINSTTVAFMLAPRINAAGRMKNASSALELLLEEDSLKAYEQATELDKINRERQQTESDIFKEALEMIESDADFEKKKIIIWAKEGWHHGVIGIVASKITDMYYKPTIMLAVDGNSAKGSGRSVDGINLFDVLTACDEYLTQFGGHAMAAGLSLNMTDFEDFCLCANKYISDNIKEEPIKALSIDCSVNADFISCDNAKRLSWFEPFGESNEKPVFAICGAKVVEASVMGADNKHLRLKINYGEKNIEAVGFSFGKYAQYLTKGRAVDLAFNLDINSFMGNEKVQLILKDIRSTSSN